LPPELTQANSRTFRHGRWFPLADLGGFPLLPPPPMGLIELLNVPEISLPATVLLDQFIADTFDFVENGIWHGLTWPTGKACPAAPARLDLLYEHNSSLTHNLSRESLQLPNGLRPSLYLPERFQAERFLPPVR
jgi:hypothetical protein